MFLHLDRLIKHIRDMIQIDQKFKLLTQRLTIFPCSPLPRGGNAFNIEINLTECAENRLYLLKYRNSWFCLFQCITLTSILGPQILSMLPYKCKHRLQILDSLQTTNHHTLDIYQYRYIPSTNKTMSMVSALSKIQL